MTAELSISTGQYSDKGRKPLNQDFYGVYLTEEPLLSTKGVAMALADGISSSDVSQEASSIAVTSFFEDYYSTSEAWSVKTSALYVLNAINSWLFSQTRRSQYRYNLDKGYVCTFSGLIIKSATAHIFHVGDARVYRLQGNTLEVLTEAHRVRVSDEQHYLKRAMGMDYQLDLDYLAVDLEPGDVFFLMTDGVYECISEKALIALYAEHHDDLDATAHKIARLAYDNGSEDNLTAQILRIEQLPNRDARDVYQELTQLPFPPQLEPREAFEGYTIARQLYVSPRSHVYLAVDDETQEQVVIKVPASDLKDDAGHLERFLLEEWIARRIYSTHVLKSHRQNRERQYFYIVTEYIDGQTLTQWMRDNPTPSVERVRDIIEQIAKGLQAFHRLEMLHQDVRPENIMIDSHGTVKIIDFGSTRVAGLEEIASPLEHEDMLGTAQYTAPEYFLGEYGTALSDQFSLAVIAYQMLSGRLPYGAEVAKARTRAAQRRLHYNSVLHDDREIPVWVDFTLRKALQPNPEKRYDEISEFVYDLRHPSVAFLNQTRPPLMERNPVAFWQGTSVLLSLIIIALLYWR